MNCSLQSVFFISPSAFKNEIYKKRKIFDCIKYFNGKISFSYGMRFMCTLCVCAHVLLLCWIWLIEWVLSTIRSMKIEMIAEYQIYVYDSGFFFIKHKARIKISVSFEINTRIFVIVVDESRSNKWHTHTHFYIECGTLKKK